MALARMQSDQQVGGALVPRGLNLHTVAGPPQETPPSLRGIAVTTQGRRGGGSNDDDVHAGINL